jgi:hypothetical protein
MLRLVLVACLLLTVCSRSTPTSGVISGRLLMVGGPANTTYPASGSVSVEGTDLSVSVDPDGRYSIPVPPGRYLLIGQSPLYGSGEGRCEAPKPVVIATGEKPLQMSSVRCCERI